MIPTYRTIERTEKENNMHTPGPWKFYSVGRPSHPDGIYLILTDNDVRAIVETFHDSDEDEANARLIAAAPNLLEALQALGAKPEGYCFCLNQEQINNGHTGECIDAQQAIEKAKE
jgi:hypothetical protein